MTDVAKTELSINSTDSRSVEIVPFGTDERIRLNVAIVQRMIAVATKSGKLPDETQCMKFIMLCKARHLNPFEGDAFLIGYDTQSGPQFSLITAHQVFLKRAEASEGFNGMQSGVIVKTEDGIEEHEGDLVLEGHKLLGGWAKVYRKDREHPFYRRLKLETFNTGQSRWNKDPAGQIVKCAEADALRSAFPTHLGGLYVREERPPLDVTGAEVQSTIPKPKFDALLTPPVQEKPKRGRKPKEQKEKEPMDRQNVSELSRRLSLAGYAFEHLREIGIEKGWMERTATYDNLDDSRAGIILENFDEVARQLDAKFGNAPPKEEKPEDKLFE